MGKNDSRKEDSKGVIARWFGLQIAAKAVSLALGLPVVSGAVAGGLAYAQGLPLFWGFVGALLSAAATSTALNQARSFLLAYNAANKITIEGVEVMRATDDAGVDGYGMGLQFENRADIPLEFQIIRISGSIEGRLAVDRTTTKGGLVDAASTYTFGVGVVPSERRISELLSGTIDFHMLYGRPGRLKHTIERSVDVRFRTDQHGSVVSLRAYHDKQ